MAEFYELFNNLDDVSEVGSDKEFYDSELFDRFQFEAPSDIDSDEESYYSNSDEEDPDGPDYNDPAMLETDTESVTGSRASPAPSTTSSTTSLPLHQPAPIRPPITATSSKLTIEAFEAMVINDPPPKKKSQYNSIGARISALKLWDCGFTFEGITKQTGVSESGVKKLRKKATDRGWREYTNMNVEVEHVSDAPKSGRPGTSQKIIDLIIKIVTRNSTTRGWSCARIAQELRETEGVTEKEAVSPSTVYRILKKQGYGVYKRTVKPGLNAKQKKARLDWCLAHEKWTLEDWKNVIFTDETSVQKGGVRGRRRVWRLKHEAHHIHVISRRWKGFSEFMWWSAFCYDDKGPYHIWEKETKEEKAECKEEIVRRNAKRYESDKAAWEAYYASKHKVTRAKPIPPFKHTPKWGLIEVKTGRGGINWYRYQKKILIEKLIPFAQGLQWKRPKIMVQEDNAPAHASKYQEEVYSFAKVYRLLWPGNSPDLNAIEPCWYWMKRKTTEKGAIYSEKELKEAWVKCWEDIPQKTIQAWIERIPKHIKKIIELEGGNEYQEGRNKGKEQVRVYS
jgi:transposase